LRFTAHSAFCCPPKRMKKLLLPPLLALLVLLLLFGAVSPGLAQSGDDWYTTNTWTPHQNHPTYAFSGYPMEVWSNTSLNMSFVVPSNTPPGYVADNQVFEWGGNNGNTSRIWSPNSSTDNDITVISPHNASVRFAFLMRHNNGGGSVNIDAKIYRVDTTAADVLVCQRSVAQNITTSWDVVNVAMLSTDCNLTALSATQRYDVRFSMNNLVGVNVHIAKMEIQRFYTPPPPPPPPPPVPTGTAVPITGTCIINSGGLTSEIPANIVPNWSYETGQVIPNDWESPDAPSNIPAMWQRNKLDAHHGQNYIAAPATTTTYNTIVRVPQPGRYLVGAYVRGFGNLSYSFGDSLNSTSNSLVVSSTTTFLAAQMVHNIESLGGTDQSKNGRLLSFGLEPGDYVLDSVFVIPVTFTDGITNTGLPTDTAGLTVYCPQLQPITTTTPVSGNTGLIGGGTIYPSWTGAGAYCTTCPTPNSMLAIGTWIAWLGCVLANLFFCWLASWISSLAALVSSMFVWAAGGLNSLISLINSGWGLLLSIWSLAVGAIEAVWGWFALFMAWLGGIVGNAALWVWDILSSIFGFYLPTTVARLWVGAQWLATTAIGGVGWVFSLVTAGAGWLLDLAVNGFYWAVDVAQQAAAWLVGIFWLIMEYLDPLTLLVWFLRLPFIQTILGVLSSIGIGGNVAFIILNGMAVAITNIYDALVELWALLRIVIDAFRGVFATDDYVVILNTTGGDVDLIEPGALNTPGMNGTKILWLGLAAIATADYLIEIFPLEIPLWLTIGALAFGVVTWTLKQWQEILPFG
jgi:hypothetical protein